MKKCFFIIIGLILISFITNAQPTPKHVKWEVKTSKTKIKKGEEIDVILTVKIDTLWCLYALHEKADTSTVLYAQSKFTPHTSYKIIGKFNAIKPYIKYDNLWEANISYFEKKGEFRQKIKIVAANPVVKFTIEYQLCNAISGMCIMGEEEFELTGLTVE